jgi:CHASE3 domain sensor protein
MNWLATRLRIGEKIVLGFGAIGLIFLGVIWLYHTTLRDILASYDDLQDVYGERQVLAFAIESRVIGVRSTAERFLLTRDPRLVEETLQAVAALRTEVDALAGIDAASASTSAELRALADDFDERFRAIADAWRIRGLDEDSGLQGAFRDAVHELEDRAGHYQVNRLYLLLLQVRRGEKDLGLRREAQYRERVHRLLDEMRQETAESELRPETKAALSDEIAAYRDVFDTYAEKVLAGAPIGGGKGPFRDRAHRIEDLLQAHYIRDLQTAVLQMRRREKDYLLRGDAEYAAMVDAIADDITARVQGSGIADADKASLVALVDGYRADFHALVDQNARIARLTEEMDAAADRITPVVQSNLTEARAQMSQKSKEIAATTGELARWSLIIAGVAPVLGFLLALLITARIVRPVHRMVGLLDRLTREAPTERLPVDPAGRDEINAMAIALNTMADHHARFTQWWRSTMQGAVACRDLSAPEKADDERIEAAVELRNAVSAQLAQLEQERGRLLDEAEELERIAGEQGRGADARRRSVALGGIAGDLRTLVGMLGGD